jgi:Dolichyl-phosphate-mannose-protein mannosyltransferase
MVTAEGPGRGRRGGGHRLVWAALALVLAVALALRLWGIRQGLPYAYNSDEDAHFVPRAIGMFTLGWNPHYFANPPAYTDLLHLLFAVWFGGRAGVAHAFATDPTAVFTVARASAALLGTLAVWLLYLAGARLFDRGVALLAAALEAVAFLPVFYAHLALNDVPTLAPLTLSLLGTAGVLRRGRTRDYLVAGVGLGLGCATKYTAGIVLLPLLAAAASQYLTAPPPVGRRVVAGLALAGAAALAAFLLVDPYSVLDLHAFEQGLAHQSSLSGEAQGKLGAPHGSGALYYLWSLTWGLGWVPAVAALGGALTVWRREQRLGWVLVPAPLLYLAFMGSQGRYFGRWLLPIFPVLCLLAAFFALQLAGAVARLIQGFIERRTPRAQRAQPAERSPSTDSSTPVDGAPPTSPKRRAAPALRTVFTALAVLALCAQGVVYSVHSGLVLARADTRNLARVWMEGHVPAGARVVVEPVVPDEWVQDVGHPTLTTPDGDRWLKYRSLRSVVDSAGALLVDSGMRAQRVSPESVADAHTVTLENYELTLAPALIGHYEQEGYCWVLTGSAEWGRAFADPSRAPHAVAYYRALARAGEVVYRVSPYSRGARPPAFNFDWSFDYYPLAYVRPGPEVTVYRLRGGRCARG